MAGLFFADMPSMRPTLLVALSFLFVTLPVPAQETAWILYQQAEKRFRERAYGQALELYGEALAAQPALPEAQVGMARIYRTEGDFVLAERYYGMAITNAMQLVVPEDVYAIRLELADMYEMWGREESYRTQLEAIVARDPVFSNPELAWQKDAMVRLLLDRGFNRVLVLYRLDFPQARAAHRLLGELYRSRGAHENAIEHLLFAAVEQGGRIVEAMIDRRFDYQFTTLDELFVEAAQHADVTAYIEASDFRATLSALAEALTSSGLDGAAGTAAEITASLQF